jgi:hypothetical protein
MMTPLSGATALYKPLGYRHRAICRRLASLFTADSFPLGGFRNPDYADTISPRS